MINWTPDMDAVLRRSTGASSRSLAATLGMSSDTVLKRMGELGIQRLQPGSHDRPSKYRDHMETIQVLLALGMSQAKIAAECGLPDDKSISKKRDKDRISEIQQELAMPAFREPTEQQLVQIRLMRAAGSPWYAVAEAIQTSETITLRWAVEHLGYEVRPRPPANPKTPQLRVVSVVPATVDAEAPPSERLIRTGGDAMPPFHPVSWDAVNVPWDEFHQRLGLG